MTSATALRATKAPVRDAPSPEPSESTTCSYCGKVWPTPAALGKHLIEDHAPGTRGVDAEPAEPEPRLPDELTQFQPEGVQGLLSFDEERLLARTLRGNGPEAGDARRIFVERNQGLVVSIAKRYLNWGLPLVDLTQDGNVGLIRAVDRFDPERGIRFSTYATWWIAQAIRRSLIDTARLVRVPSNVLDVAAKARRMMRDNPSLDVDEIAEAIGIEPVKVAEAIGFMGAHSISMESGDRNGDGRGTLGSELSSPEEPTRHLDPQETERLLDGLPTRHRHVIVRRFGLDGRPPAELEAVGRELRLTRERVRQIEAQALAYLRKHRVKEGAGGDLSLDLSTAPPLRVRQAKARAYEADPNAAPKDRPAERRTPLPHQEEALAAILPELEVSGRATAVMACGTGKTLVGAWAFQRSGGRTALVLAPSLGLLRQTLREWTAHDAADRYLCVCGDATVRDQGEIAMSAQDLGIPVTTDPHEVRRALFDARGRTAVVCTYQSARALGAGLPPGFSFDMAVFDEAHRTAGERDRNFSFGLLDTQIAARRRLFMTATPRGVPPDGSDEGPFSMDDERVYGRRVYELGLSEAIARGIVCDYRIVIAVVTEADVAGALRGDPGMISKGVAHARRAAHAEAFARAVQDCGAAKIITFHDSVAAAERFAFSRRLRQDLLPEGFQSYHVNGRMTAGDRQAVLSMFESASASIITNARCLTEGIDVPAVDMVAFMSPRRSPVDIIQAIGRALRKAPGKSVGYVLLPILVDGNGDPVSGAKECREVTRVIQGIRSQDMDLDRRVRMAAFDKGSGVRADREALDGRLVIAGSEALPEAVRNAITTKILSPDGASWDEMFGRLLAFRRSHGTLKATKSEAGRQLMDWIAEQRRARRRRRLSDRQVKLLDAVEFPWEPNKGTSDSTWMEKYALVRKFHQEGDRDLRGADEKLRLWATVQRGRRKKGLLEARRARLLDAIGFKWSKSERRLLRPREFSRERAEIGTIRVRRDFTNGRDVEVRWIKVSDDGPEAARWKPYARWWWEKNRGPVPAGMGVIHKNGDSMDDSPANLMVGTAADRIRLAHINDPEMSQRNMRTVHEGCAKWNREQGKQSRFRNIVKNAWYPAVPALKVVLNVPFRKRIGVFRAFGVDVSRMSKNGHGPEVRRAAKASGIRPVSSSEMTAEPYLSYARVDVDLGLANPEAAGRNALDRVRAVMESPLWRRAKAAAELDVHERK